MKWKDNNLKFKIGIMLIGISLLFFTLLIVFPLLNIERGMKITLTTISFILAEVFFYSGGFLLGKEMFNKYKYWFNPLNWFKKRKSTTDLKEKETLSN